ncbi:MAG: STAS domain-containing protein [Pseudomonadota bacterium]
MEITTRREKDAIVVSLKGSLDTLSYIDFDKTMEALMAQGDKDFIFDLAELEYISSSGLKSLLTMGRKLENRGGHLFLFSLQNMVKDVFKISGTSTIIPIYESLEEAFAQI